MFHPIPSGVHRLTWPIRLAALAIVPGTCDARADASLDARIAAVTERPDFRHALWGIEIYDADAGRPLCALNEDKFFTLASTTRLLSAGTLSSIPP